MPLAAGVLILVSQRLLESCPSTESLEGEWRGGSAKGWKHVVGSCFAASSRLKKKSMSQASK